MSSHLADEEELISVARAAHRLGVSAKTIRRRFEIVHIGDRVLVRVADVRRVVEG